MELTSGPHYSDGRVVQSDETSALLLHNENGSKKSLTVAGGSDSVIDKTRDDDSEDYLRPSMSSWLRLFVFFASSVITGGITNGQDVFNRLFAEAGLLRSVCGDAESFEGTTCPEQFLIIANIMNVLALCSSGLFLPAGVLFDAYGGRTTAVIGCVIMMAGLVVIIALLSSPALLGVRGGSSSPLEVPLFVLGVYCVDAGSFCINVSFFAFLWHLPGHHAFIASLANCCYAISSFLPLAMVRAMEWLDLRLAHSFMLYGLAVAGCARLCWTVVPSEAEYITRAARVLGVPIPRKRGISWAKLKKGVHGAVQVLGLRKVAHGIMMFLCALAYFVPFFYITLANPLGDELFGKGEGSQFGEVFNRVNGITGLFLGPLLGVLADHLQSPADGLFELAVINGAALLIISSLSRVAVWSAQLVVLISTCTSYQAMFLYLVRYIILFSPPHRVGTVQGIVVLSFAMLDLPFILGVSFGIANGNSYAMSIFWAVTVAGICWALYAALLRAYPPWPDAPEFTKEDERKVSKPFMVGTIDDAAHVLGISHEQFLRLAASSNVLDQRRLFELTANENAEKRLLDMARCRCPVPPLPPPSSMYSIPENVDEHAQSDAEIIFGTAETSTPAIELSFNGHGGHGGKTEPLIQWMFEPLHVPLEHPLRVQLTQYICAPLFHVAEAYGVVLEARVPREDGTSFVAAACAAFPPGSLVYNYAMPVGHERWFYGFAKSGARIMPLDKTVRSSGTLYRLTAFSSELHFADRIRARGARRMWYIQVLGTHPACQGKGYARHLLAVVAKWADAGGFECYLECSEDNVAFYRKCGFVSVWKRTLSDLETGGPGVTAHGVARPPSR